MVTYLVDERMPGKRLFGCERLLAKLTDTSCAANWRAANHDHSEQRSTCRLCPIGAEHAGESGANLSQWRGTMVCARCNRYTERLIGKHVCVSCKNREYEHQKGANAKGTAPIKALPLSERSLTYLEGGRYRRVTRRLTANSDELLMGVLRDSSDKVTLSFHSTAYAAPQLVLF